MTFAEHAVAQVLREVAAELLAKQMQGEPPLSLPNILFKIAHKLSPRAPGEK